MRSSRTIFLGLVLAISGLVCTGLKAQESRAHVQGVVTDASGGAISGATVTLANVRTGVKMTAPTNDVGLYRFEQVDPGLYTITVESQGFGNFRQQNFEVRASGDVTVNATLTVGGVQQNITVEGLAVEIPFNTSDDNLTFDQKTTQELPRFERNPFKLSLLQPTVVDTRPTESNPYNTYSANSVELGGQTNLKNDLEVDGSTVSIGYKVAYVPNPDAVQEATVEKNAVDASVGHSAGGTLSMASRSGTNEIHGSGSWLERIPTLSALSDRTTGAKNASRNNIYSAAVGHRIIKNKLFNFTSFEVQRSRTAGSSLYTVPNAAMRAGDFSQALNANGSQKVIYDPYTTVFNASTGTATRQAFPGNVIPSSRFDPLGALWASQLPVPNRTPDNPTLLNDFVTSTLAVWNYWNLSDRVDYYPTSKLRFFTRPSWYRTHQVTNAPQVQTSPLYFVGGSNRDGFSLATEMIYTLSANTILDFHGDYRDFIDEYWSPLFNGANGEALASSAANPYTTYWPGNNWHAPYQNPQYPQMLPGIVLAGSGQSIFGAGFGNLWRQQPSGSSFSARLSQTRGKHFLKFGIEERRTGGRLLANAGNQFTFDPALTANTFLNPNTALSGSSFATLLLGAINDSSQMVNAPYDHDRIIYYGAYVQDDFKPTRNITLNLGLRWEYETPWYDPFHEQSRGLDFSQPAPFVSQAPPQIPSSITSMLNVPYSWTGSWDWTTASNPGVWKNQYFVFMPRAGVAWRIDDSTSLRFGYARYVIPSELNYTGPPYGSFEAVNFMQPLLGGYDTAQAPLPLANGIPQATVSNPFPAATNPLVTPGGVAQGANVALGVPAIGWEGADYSRPVNDRFNISFAHQLPNHIIVDTTLFANFAHNLSYAYNLNQVDPRIIYQYKGATSVTVANPFYNYLSPQQFPGQFRNLATVPITQLLVQRPQYGALWEAFKPGAKERYYSMDLRVQRPFSHGFNFMVAYSYIREKTQVLGSGTNQAPQVAGVGAWFEDPLNNYLNQLTYLDSPLPHHRATISGTYQFPFGKGRHFLSTAPKAVDGVVGGWQVIGAWYFHSGDYLQFGPANVSCADPSVSNPTPSNWFNTSCFSVLPSYTPRTNPNHYSDIRGPIYWTSQASLSKQVPVTDRLKIELRASAYNLTNRLNRADPDVTITDAAFGESLRQASAQSGRQVEYGVRILF